MSTFNNVSEFDMAWFAQHKLVSIRFSAAMSADQEGFSNAFLAKHMQDFVNDFEEDGVIDGLTRFEHMEMFRKASLLLLKLKAMMVVAVEEYSKDSSFDMKKAFAELAEAFQTEGCVISWLNTYMNDNPDEREFYSKSALKSRGWTDAMIREFLEKPDIDLSPVCGFMGYRSYYLDTKVEAAEKTTAFKKWMKLKNQRAKARTAVAAGGVN